MNLRRRLAAFGFESNDDYEFALKILFESKPAGLRCLNVTGESGRRKTAFAHALGGALEYPHVLYHDFSRADSPLQTVVIDPESGQTGTIEAAMSAFERAVTEACAYSEGARVMLILDQIQACPFQDQVRLYHFVQRREWTSPLGTVTANPATLLLVLISEAPLYHSLQKVSFRIHTDAAAQAGDLDPRDYGFGPEAGALFAALSDLFRELGQGPTPSEMQHLLGDLLQRVRTVEHLRTSLYGWMENLERARLYLPSIQPALERVLAEINRFLGVEEIEL
jgi:hypothetical protein